MKKIILKILIATFVISALLGIGIITFEIWNETTLKILLTTITLFAFSIPTLCCILCYEKKKNKIMPSIGMALSGITYLYILLLIWEVLGVEIFDGINYEFITLGTILSASFGHMCLVEGIQEKTNLVKYMKIGTIIGSLFIDLMIVIQVLFDIETYTKLNMIVLILVVLGTIIIPLINKLNHVPAYTNNDKNNEDKYKELERLKQLLDNNILTQQEFELEKQKILNK